MTDVLQSLWRGPVTLPVSKPTMAQIIREVAEGHGLTPEDLKGRERGPVITPARQEAMWRCREELGKTWKQIAIAFDRSDHTTPIAAWKEHERRRLADG